MPTLPDARAPAPKLAPLPGSKPLPPMDVSDPSVSIGLPPPLPVLPAIPREVAATRVQRMVRGRSARHVVELMRAAATAATLKQSIGAVGIVRRANEVSAAITAATEAPASPTPPAVVASARAPLVAASRDRSPRSTRAGVMTPGRESPTAWASAPPDADGRWPSPIRRPRSSTASPRKPTTPRSATSPHTSPRSRVKTRVARSTFGVYDQQPPTTHHLTTEIERRYAPHWTWEQGSTGSPRPYNSLLILPAPEFDPSRPRSATREPAMVLSMTPTSTHRWTSRVPSDVPSARSPALGAQAAWRVVEAGRESAQRTHRAQQMHLAKLRRELRARDEKVTAELFQPRVVSRVAMHEAMHPLPTGTPFLGAGPVPWRTVNRSGAYPGVGEHW